MLRSVGWLLEEKIGRPGLPGLCTLGRTCYPLHTKKAIPSSLALRLRRICSTDATFNTRAV